MFIQIIQGRCHDADRVHRLSDEWREKLGPSAEGWLGGTYGVTDDGEFVAVVRFSSREAATANARRPEQGEWWTQMHSCFDGEVTFHDCDNAMTFLGGGSDDAGFVQIIQGRVSDPDAFRHLMEEPMDTLREARPEIIGGTIAIEPDGWFTQTVCFRTEEEARQAEQQELPAEFRQRYEDQMREVAELRYLDLHHPWFSSAAASAG